MKIKLPKDLRGIKFSRVFSIDMNNFDIDIFLPSLFYTILAQGKRKARQVNSPTTIKKYIDAFAVHPALEGFDTLEGQRVLERLVRTTLITTGSAGRARTTEQITSIVPYTLLSHKAGFPAETSRQRGADTFIYQALKECMEADDRLRDFIKMVFGHGIITGNISELGGNYDGKTELDTLTRLSIAFLDGFENTRPGISREKNLPDSCPGLARELATDLIRYLFTYYTSMPIQAFTYHLLILINFELFNYTLKLVHAINELVRNPETLPPAMCIPVVQPSPPHIYVDFTGKVSGPGQEMAKACVQRDIDAYQQFLYANLQLRQLDSYVESLKKNSRRRAEIEKKLPPTSSGAEYLQGLLLLQNDSALKDSLAATARLDTDRIFQENTLEEDVDDPAAQQWLEAIANTAADDIEQLVNLLAEGQREEAMKHYTQWYLSVGGIRKAQGILRGNVRGRKSWRYEPTNDLLAVLVQLAAARQASTHTSDGNQEVEALRLQDFLKFLEERFGILVDHPPAPFEGAEYIAAAQDNLRAMLYRLKQMGIFRDLSDDFTVQRLHPPYAKMKTTTEMR